MLKDFEETKIRQDWKVTSYRPCGYPVEEDHRCNGEGEKFIGPDNCLEIKYEDLSANL